MSDDDFYAIRALAAAASVEHESALRAQQAELMHAAHFEQQQLLAAQAEAVGTQYATTGFDATQYRRDLDLESADYLIRRIFEDDTYVPPVTPNYGYDEGDPNTPYSIFAVRDDQAQREADAAVQAWSQQAHDEAQVEAIRRMEATEAEAMNAFRADIERRAQDDAARFLIPQDSMIDNAARGFFDDFVARQQEAADAQAAAAQQDALALAEREREETNRLYTEEIARAEQAAADTFQRQLIDEMNTLQPTIDASLRQFESEQLQRAEAEARVFHEQAFSNVDQWANEAASRLIDELRHSIKADTDEAIQNDLARWAEEDRRAGLDAAVRFGASAADQTFEDDRRHFIDNAYFEAFEPRRQEIEREAQDELLRHIADAERAAADEAHAIVTADLERGRAELLAEYGEDRERFAAELARLDAERTTADRDIHDAQAEERRRLEDAALNVDDRLQEALAMLARDAEERSQLERRQLEEEAVRAAEERIRAELERDIAAAAAAATHQAEAAFSHREAELRTNAELHGREAEASAIAHWTDGYAERAASYAAECEAHHQTQAISRAAEDEARLREECLATAQRHAETQAEERRVELLSEAHATVARHAEELATSAEAETRNRVAAVVAQTHEAALSQAERARDTAHDAIDRQFNTTVAAAAGARNEHVRVAAEVALAEGERIRADGRTNGIALAEQIKARALDEGYAQLRSFLAKHKLAFIEDIEGHIARLAAQDWSELSAQTKRWLDTEFGTAEDGADRVRRIAARLESEEADAFMESFDESRQDPIEPLEIDSPGERAGKIADMVSDLFRVMPESRRNAAGKVLGRGLAKEIGDMLPPTVTDSSGQQIFGYDGSGRAIPFSTRSFSDVWRDALSSSNAAQANMADARRLSTRSEQARSAGDTERARVLHRRAAASASRAYEQALGGFWRRIRDPEHRHLRALFENGFYDRDGNKLPNGATGAVYDGAGMDFGFRKSGGPVYRLSDGSLEGVTLEHQAEKALDPSQAVEVGNLLFSLRHENSWILQKIRKITRPVGFS